MKGELNMHEELLATALDDFVISTKQLVGSKEYFRTRKIFLEELDNYIDKKIIEAVSQLERKKSWLDL